jgi:hypothetical protein
LLIAELLTSCFFSSSGFQHIPKEVLELKTVRRFSPFALQGLPIIQATPARNYVSTAGDALPASLAAEAADLLDKQSGQKKKKT